MPKLPNAKDRTLSATKEKGAARRRELTGKPDEDAVVVQQSDSGFTKVGQVRRAWTKLAVLWHTRSDGTKDRATGVHMNYLHSTPTCSYLQPRRLDGSTSRIVEVTGELLTILTWCSRCTPRRHGAPHISRSRPFPMLDPAKALSKTKHCQTAKQRSGNCL